MGSTIGYTILEDLFFLVIFFTSAYFFGRSFYKIYAGKLSWGHRVTDPIVSVCDKAIGIEPKHEMTPKEYAIHVAIFSFLNFLIGWILLMVQGFLFWNPNDIPNMSWDLALNSVVSFVTNTNWQAYSGETQASYMAQTLVFTVQNFVSGAVGIAVLFAVIRGIVRHEQKTIGNFYHDLFRILFNVMLPLCFVISIIFVWQGIPQTFGANVSYSTLEGGVSTLYLGPAASQIVIKQLFTNGGGFYGFNSAVPFENPTILTNYIECVALIAMPLGLVYTFGKAVAQKKQGGVIMAVMTFFFILCLVFTTWSEFANANGPFNSSNYLTYGNMEGKETRFGIGLSSLWGVATTSASNGSVNAMHDSFTPMGGMIETFLMMLGEIIYGGVGCGFYGMLAFVYLTVFIAGLMVGRTPEYLGKKVDSFDMKMVCLVILTPIVFLLLGTGATVLLPSTVTGVGKDIPSSGNAVNNPAHFFAEILYAFASWAGNNGSAFAGLGANTVWMNVIGSIIMAAVRFVPMFAMIFLAGSMVQKKEIPQSNGTLRTDNALFGGLLIGVILIVGALSFFPALALGPIAEALS